MTSSVEAVFVYTLNLNIIKYLTRLLVHGIIYVRRVNTYCTDLSRLETYHWVCGPGSACVAQIALAGVGVFWPSTSKKSLVLSDFFL